MFGDAALGVLKPEFGWARPEPDAGLDKLELGAPAVELPLVPDPAPAVPLAPAPPAPPPPPCANTTFPHQARQLSAVIPKKNFLMISLAFCSVFEFGRHFSIEF
jgi:hypothetical protein